MAKLQAASVLIGWAAAPYGTDRRTDRAIPTCPTRAGYNKLIVRSHQLTTVTVARA